MNIIAPARVCPECGVAFTAHHGRQRFCTPAHQTAFHDVMKVRGKVAMPLAQTWRLSKNKQTDVRKFAFAQLCALLDQWNAEDRAAGRNAGIIAAGKHRSGWAAADLT